MYRYLLRGAISAEMPRLVALETTPFGVLLCLLLLPCVYVHGLSLPAEHLLHYRMPLALRVAIWVLARGTCRTPCIAFAGGGNLLEVPGLLVVASVALTDAMGLIVGVIALSSLVHDEDSLLPFVVVLGNPYPDAGDDQCVRPWHPLSHSGDHRSAAISIIAPSCQLGFAFQFLEEYGGGIAHHLHCLHLRLMHFFACGVSERGLELPYEVVPMWVSESGAGRIAVVVDPKVFATMGPPVFGTFDEERGGAYYHERGNALELMAERFEVRVAVAYEAIHVVVLSFEGLGQLHDDRP